MYEGNIEGALAHQYYNYTTLTLGLKYLLTINFFDRFERKKSIALIAQLLKPVVPFTKERRFSNQTVCCVSVESFNHHIKSIILSLSFNSRSENSRFKYLEEFYGNIIHLLDNLTLEHSVRSKNSKELFLNGVATRVSVEDTFELIWKS